MQGRRNRFALTALVGLGAVFGVTRADATPELRLTSGTSSVLAVGAGDSVSFSGSVGAWNLNITTGLDQGVSAPAIMDLNSLDHHNLGSSAPLTIWFSDNGFAPALAPFNLEIGGTMSSGGTITAALFGGNSNTLFDTTHQLGLSMNFTAGAFSGTESVSKPTSTLDPYSLTEQVVLNFGGQKGLVSFDQSVVSVPEPATLGLMALGLAFVGFARPKRKS